MKLVIQPWMSSVTKKVIADFNVMSAVEFMQKYQCSKLRYARRVMKYGDPYLHAPLAKIGKWLTKMMYSGSFRW